MNKGMDQEYFDKILKMQLELPQISIINISPVLFENVVKSYTGDTINAIIKILDFMEEKEVKLNKEYWMIRNICWEEIRNRTLFQYLNSKNLNTYLKISLN